MICSSFGATAGTGVGSGAVAAAGCNNDWNTAWIGSRTQWNVTKDFYMGVDVLYEKLDGLSTPGNIAPATIATSACNLDPRQACHNESVDNWAFRFRVHRDFYP